MFEIKVTITTKSNCLIGNQTGSFSVGGVDQATTVDEKGLPIIHGSAFKGALRNIVRENEAEMENTLAYVKCILEDLEKRYKEISKNSSSPQKDKIDKIIGKIGKYKEEPKAEYIFGVEGLNGLPRLFCTDFCVTNTSEDKNKRNINKYFSIETKNSLEESGNEVISQPRTYRVVKPGVCFEGVLTFRDTYFNNSEEELQEIREELKKQLAKFNQGFYGIGNSKSRGYGRIEIECE